MPTPQKKPSMIDNRRASVLAGFLRSCDIQCASLLRQSWPDPKYYNDPVGFVKVILRENPLPHQEDMLRAVAGKKKLFAIRSGRRVGKSKLVVWLALWWYCTRPSGSRVIMTATTEKQINDVLWTELKLTIWKARQSGFQIDTPGPTCKSGLHSVDMRSVFGIAPGSVDALAGLAGPELLFIVDEAASLGQDYLDILEGNMAGGHCKLVMISNPRHQYGPFYDAFHSLSSHYVKFHVDSQKLAIWLSEKGMHFKGIADAEWVADMAEKHPKDSPFWLIDVLGEFCTDTAGRIVTPTMLEGAQNRWDTLEAAGNLSLGVDPAGDGDFGDEWGFSLVRGRKCLSIFARRGLSVAGGVSEIEALIRSARRDDEVPRVMVDSEGPIGSELLGELQARSHYLKSTNPREYYEVYGVKSSKPAIREPQMYERLRDELWAGIRSWLEVGGIPRDYKLGAELMTPGFATKITSQGSKLVATAKKDIRELIGRSPDRADALALAIWDPTDWLAKAGLQTPAKVAAEAVRESTLPDDDYWDDLGDGVIDPYSTRGKPSPY